MEESEEGVNIPLIMRSHPFLHHIPLCSGTSPFYSDRILSLAIIPMVDLKNCRVLSFVKTARFFSALSYQIDTKYKICEEP